LIYQKYFDKLRLYESFIISCPKQMQKLQITMLSTPPSLGKPLWKTLFKQGPKNHFQPSRLLANFCYSVAAFLFSFFACAQFNENKSQPQTKCSIQWTAAGCWIVRRIWIWISQIVRAALHTPKIVYLTPMDLHFGAGNSKFWQKFSNSDPRTIQQSVEEKGI